jgi:outer membrane protein OmpA-like peptidoglycan-associated protein
MQFRAWRITMKRLQGTIGGLAAGIIGFLLFGYSASAQLVSREQIVEALTTQPASLRFTDKLRLTRSLTLANGDYAVASAQPKPTIDLHEIYFEFNSAAITADAKPQLRELGAALSDPRLKGSTISIGGHTDAVGSDAFNKVLSERRAAAVKWYLVDNFRLSPENLHTVGYGKQQPKNKADVFAPENRRVEIVNETFLSQARH